MKSMLPARPPFSFASVVNSHGWVQLAPFVLDKVTGGFDYAVRLSTGRVVDVRVAGVDGGAEVQLPDDVAPGERSETDYVVAWMLGLDQEFHEFYELARQEPALAQMEARAQGRVLRSATLFEDTVKTILTTNTSWAGTLRMVARLVELYGAPLASDPARRSFPTPERLASLDETALRSEARLGFRAPSVLALSRQVASGSVDLEELRNAALPTEDVRRSLLGIRGVGDYAAANLLMLLGRYDAIPVDSWARYLVSKEWHGGQQVGRAEVEAAFARWGRWQGLAYWFWQWS